MVRENLEKVLERIASAALRSGRRAEDVTLVAVTKTHPVESILSAASAGTVHIGESRVQESEEKFAQIAGKVPLVWHMIGHLQSNKAARAVKIFDVIESVDSLKLLRFIDREAGQLNKVQRCLIEIKLSDEETKSGMAESGLDAFIQGAKNATEPNMEIKIENKAQLMAVMNKACAGNRDTLFLDLAALVAAKVKIQ